MRIQIASDLHLEFHRDGGDEMIRELSRVSSEVDVLVLAGDIVPLVKHSGVDAIFANFLALYTDVIYVSGNHDYYGSSPEQTRERMQELRTTYSPRLHVLDGDRVEINGQGFVGATLWFPPPPSARLCRALADYELIQNFTSWVYERHARDLTFLNEVIRANDVVITHHLPHAKSIDPRYENSQINCFFHAADCDRIVETKQPKLWIHGHTHNSCDYLVGETRVIANPFGYPNEPGTNFNPALILEV